MASHTRAFTVLHGVAYFAEILH